MTKSKVVATAIAAVVAGALMYPAPAATDDDVGFHWTYDYTCKKAFFSNEHRVTDGGDDFAPGPHETIPGDCSVHPSAN